jgi:hypothetical protein
MDYDPYLGRVVESTLNEPQKAWQYVKDQI